MLLSPSDCRLAENTRRTVPDLRNPGSHPGAVLVMEMATAITGVAVAVGLAAGKSEGLQWKTLKSLLLPE